MKKYIIVFAAIAILGSACSAVNANTLPIKNLNDEATAYAQHASNKFMKKDFNGAITSLNQAIKISSDSPLLYLNRGFVKQFIKDYSGALEDYNYALKIDPNYTFAYNNRAVLKVSMNDIEGAMNDYAKALSINKNYSDVYYNRGNLKYMLNDLQGALDDYNNAIRLNPKDSEAYNNRGVVKKRLNLNVGALSDYSQAIALNPKDSIAYANRGRLKKLYFDNQGAAIDLNQAVALAENQVFIKNVKPLLSKNEYIAAIPTVSAFAYDFTDDADYNYKIPNENNSKVESKEQNTNKIAMNVTPAYNKMVTEEVDKKNQVPKKINNATGAYSNTDTPVLKAGVGTIGTPKVPDIRTTAVTQNATTNIKLAESYYIRGLQKCVLRDLQGAITDLDKAIANNSKYADAYFYRAAIKKELGDKEGFRKDYATAIQINPSLQTYNDANALSLVSG